MVKSMEKYLSGEELYGNDFGIDEIVAWFEDEKEGYADLGAKEKKTYNYSYHALNNGCGFQYINKSNINKVLGIGSAYGDELKPVLKYAEEITILEPSGAFRKNNISGVPCHYISPEISGEIPFEDNQYDLITSFGVLHHIPNVTYVLSEISRCLSADGTALIREPITSMGDWRKKRPGLTKRERGIPVDIFDKIINDAGLRVIKKSYCMFPPLSILAKKLGIAPYNSKMIVYIDLLLSKLFYKNYKYHALSSVDKFRPTSVFYVLKKI